MTRPAIMRERTIHNALKAKVTEFGNREFFRFGEDTFGYEDLDRESDKVATGLQGLGIIKGDKVAVMSGNRPEFLFTWFALAKLGAVLVPMNTAHKGELLTYMLNQADCRMMVMEAEFLGQLAPCLDDLPKIERLVVLDGDGAGEAARPVTAYGEMIDNDGTFEAPEILWSDPYVIMFTSGTTGPSKGAVMPHNYAISMAETVCASASLTESDCLYNALPLFHGNAQVLSTMPALISGARMVLAARFSASRIWDEIRKYGCTEFNYIGGIIPILMKAEPKPDDADNPLRVMMGGGAPPDLFEACQERFGVKLVEGYGMSEIGLPLMNSMDDPRCGNCGRVNPNYEVRLIDDNGLEVAQGEPGEAIIRPVRPYDMMLEYYNMPDKTVEAWRDLWFHTGDYLRMDEDEYYYFVDRKKDALRRRGENISSYEVEKTVNSHPAVLESAAVAAESELGEDEVMVCLTLKPGESVTPEDLTEFCQERMAYFMVPRYLRILDALPKTPTERVKKYQLREEGITADTWDREATS